MVFCKYIGEEIACHDAAKKCEGIARASLRLRLFMRDAVSNLRSVDASRCTRQVFAFFAVWFFCLLAHHSGLQRSVVI